MQLNIQKKKFNCIQKEETAASASSSTSVEIVGNDHDADNVDFSSEYPPTKKQKQAKILFEPVQPNNKESAHENKGCTICLKKDNDASTLKVNWVDCNTCNAWAHKLWATEGGWKNLRQQSW